MFIIKSRRKRALSINQPLRHESHKRPVTRRDFLAQGFMTGAATVVAPSMLGMLMNPRVSSALSPDIRDMATNICRITAGAGKVPFICFDLAGGANIVGSNVLVGKEGGQLDFLSTQGYSKQGLPGTMLPNNATTNFINTELGLAFHSDSAFLRGILEKTSPTTRANINGAIFAARSENDTGNNPHNPMYGIARAGAKGELLTLIGSQNSDSGGNSMAPAMLMDPANRPTKIDRTSDVTGLVDTGELGTLFTDSRDTVAVMESMVRISNAKMGRVTTGLPAGQDTTTEDQFRCGYVKTADTVEKFSSPAALNPSVDPDITGAGGVFGPAFGNDREFEKTAAVMKLVVDGYAGAGTVSMGGFDYHTATARRARCATCAPVAAWARVWSTRRGAASRSCCTCSATAPSHRTVGSTTRPTVAARASGPATTSRLLLRSSWSTTRSAEPTLLNEDNIALARRQQMGYFSAAGDVVTSSSPVANNVNVLVQAVLLNYMALHGEAANFPTAFPGHGLGVTQTQRAMIAFNPIVNGRIT